MQLLSRARLPAVSVHALLFAFGWLVLGLLFFDALCKAGSGESWPVARAVSGSAFYFTWFLPAFRQWVRQKKL